MKELIEIQSQLKAPKSKYNSFGKYNYRSCEDILEAVKPLLKEHNCTLIITDEIIMVGARYYVRAYATIQNEEGHQFTGIGFAREDDEKKGMDGSQITGTASSYARKYALNGLFLIDDTKDADTEEYQNQVSSGNVKQPKPIKYPELDTEQELLAEAEANKCTTVAELSDLYNKYNKINPNYTKPGSVFMNALSARKQDIISHPKTTIF